MTKRKTRLSAVTDRITDLKLDEIVVKCQRNANGWHISHLGNCGASSCISWTTRPYGVIVLECFSVAICIDRFKSGVSSSPCNAPEACNSSKIVLVCLPMACNAPSLLASGIASSADELDLAIR